MVKFIRHFGVYFVGFFVILFTIYIAILFVAHDYDPDFLSVDGCLDKGGCWDYENRVCRDEEPNAQELCDKGNPHK